DIFALGAIVYEVLAGVPPCLINIREPTTHVIGWAQINRMPPPLDELTNSVPSHVARIIQRMIAKNPVDRPATMGEVSEALRGAAARLGPDGGTRLRDLWKAAATEAAGPSVDTNTEFAPPFESRVPTGESFEEADASRARFGAAFAHTVSVPSPHAIVPSP